MVFVALAIVAEDSTSLMVFGKDPLAKFVHCIFPSKNNFSMTTDSAVRFFFLFAVFTLVSAMHAFCSRYGCGIIPTAVTRGLNVDIIYYVLGRSALTVIAVGASSTGQTE